MRKEIDVIVARMKTATCVVLTIAAGLGGFIVGIETSDGPSNSSSFLQTLFMAVTTIAAAFGGAWAAYELQWKRLESDRKEERLRLLNSTQLSIAQALQLLEQIFTDTLDPHRENTRRFLSMPNSLEHNIENIRLNPEKIVFVLDKRHANFLLRLSVVERKFISAIATFNERSKIHREKVLPQIEKQKNFDFDKFHQDELVELIGMQIFGMLLSITDRCYDSIDSTIVEMKNISRELTTVSMEMYPGAAIISPVE